MTKKIARITPGEVGRRLPVEYLIELYQIEYLRYLEIAYHLNNYQTSTQKTVELFETALESTGRRFNWIDALLLMHERRGDQLATKRVMDEILVRSPSKLFNEKLRRLISTDELLQILLPKTNQGTPHGIQRSLLKLCLDARRIDCAMRLWRNIITDEKLLKHQHLEVFENFAWRLRKLGHMKKLNRARAMLEAQTNMKLDEYPGALLVLGKTKEAMALFLEEKQYLPARNRWKHEGRFLGQLARVLSPGEMWNYYKKLYAGHHTKANEFFYRDYVVNLLSKPIFDTDDYVQPARKDAYVQELRRFISAISLEGPRGHHAFRAAVFLTRVKRYDDAMWYEQFGTPTPGTFKQRKQATTSWERSFDEVQRRTAWPLSPELQHDGYLAGLWIEKSEWASRAGNEDLSKLLMRLALEKANGFDEFPGIKAGIFVLAANSMGWRQRDRFTAHLIDPKSTGSLTVQAVESP